MEVESLLRAAWIALTLPILAAFINIDAARRFALHHLLGRGKIMASNNSLRDLSVPQKYFSHFYIFGFICNTILLVAIWVYANSSSLGVGVGVGVGVGDENYKNGIWQSVLLLLLFEAQLLRRIVESLFIFKYSPTARMHLFSYLLSFYYYAAVSMSLCCKYCVEALKHIDNRELNGIWGSGGIVINPVLQLKWYAWIGAAVFFWGWIHQRRCHAILYISAGVYNIRKNGGKVKEYAIPEGDWFEIVIYGGFSDVTIWLLFIFVVANLALTADETHKWYLRKFDNYPKNRYAIIPFIY